ncbi:MAG: hypothetical protein FIA89_08985 [Geobacter sp.]|nr:hypothetical protein [Geobacter sp.]
MNVTLTFWQLVTLLLGFMGFVWGAARILLAQIDRRLDEKFKAQEEARKTGDANIQDMLKRHIDEEAKNGAQLIQLERQMLRWQADMPLQYVRREDFIRNQTIIESKLDGLAVKLENAQLKGGGTHA